MADLDDFDLLLDVADKAALEGDWSKFRLAVKEADEILVREIVKEESRN